MTEHVEQRYCIKFCQKLGDSQSETIRKIQQVFGKDAMGVTQFKEGSTDSKVAAQQRRVTSVLAGPKLLGVQLLLRGCEIW